ncbi:hypothetical protein IWQ62_004534 [Dispira parvispora]|uniref:Rab3-GAP regulatory subunit N-terminal domain-containing protein n=1 Tax=Dispira parvispora TaxID=1520584 RepID=A0A9W8ALF7_9FUNG|nr:hypothetical protein IWQ62_004534 [Dispira parvispora]
MGFTPGEERCQLVLDGLVPLGELAKLLNLCELDTAEQTPVATASPIVPTSPTTTGKDSEGTTLNDHVSTSPDPNVEERASPTSPSLAPSTSPSADKDTLPLSPHLTADFPSDHLRQYNLRMVRAAVSLRSEYTVLATERRYVLLHRSALHRGGKPRLTVVSYGPEFTNEHITAAYCLPVFVPPSRGTMVTANHDVVVIVGYSNGGVRFFSRDGHLLLSQRLHSMPLVKIKFRQAKPDNPFVADPFEDPSKPLGLPTVPPTSRRMTTSIVTPANARQSGQDSSFALRRQSVGWANGKFPSGSQPVPARSGGSGLGEEEEDDDELLLVYADGQVLVIQGKSLWIALRICLGELSAYLTQSRLHLDRDSALESHYTPPSSASFSYRKFALGSGTQLVRDVISCGPTWRGRRHEPASAVRAMLNDANPNQIAAFDPALIKATARFMAVGGDPMVALYATGKTTSLSYSVSSMAGKFANKVTSAVLSLARSYWWSGSQDRPNTRPLPHRQQGKFLDYDLSAGDAELEGTTGWSPPTTIPMVTHLADGHRHMNQITMAPPEYQLAVMTDNFGRVHLIDIAQFEVVRLWKGLRDCQCGWIEVPVDPAALHTSHDDLNATLPGSPPPWDQFRSLPTSPRSPQFAGSNPTHDRRSSYLSTGTRPFPNITKDGSSDKDTLHTSSGGEIDSTNSIRIRRTSVAQNSMSAPQFTIRLRRDSRVNYAPTRKALLLVLYASRRGIVEIYRMRHGDRLATFQVGPHWKLLSTPTQSLGGSMILDNGLMSKRVDDAQLAQCTLLSPDGKVWSFKIPPRQVTRPSLP